jgi:hypothetical protein
MVVYKVFYKSYELRKGELVGILIERREDLRGKTRLESGLRWARCSFADSVKDRHAIFIVPKELELGGAPQWMVEKGVFIREELLGIRELADPVETHSVGGNRGTKIEGAAIRIRQNLFSSK